MKFGAHIAVTGMALAVASAGVLFPIYGKVGGLQEEVASLEAEQATGGAIEAQFMQLEAEKRDLEERIAGRQFRLLPDNQEAHHNFETRLLQLVGDSGLNSVRTGRGKDAVGGLYRHLDWELVVEGAAGDLDRFLISLERIEWVTRVQSLQVEPGDEMRRITMKIAVMLETKGNA